MGDQNPIKNSQEASNKGSFLGLVLGTPKRDPREAQERPKRAPREAQESPRGAQEEPKKAQEEARGSQESHKRLPRESNKA